VKDDLAAGAVECAEETTRKCEAGLEGKDGGQSRPFRFWKGLPEQTAAEATAKRHTEASRDLGRVADDDAGIAIAGASP